MRRVLALGLAAILLAGLAGTGQAGVARLAEAPTAGTDSAAPASKNVVLARVPLILVHGLGGNGEAFEAPLGLGLEQRFVQAGYRKGESLFVLDYGEDSNGDYAHVARDHLAPLVEQVMSATGTDRVDLLGYSMGGLVVRYFLNLPGQAAPVRTAVLLASPAHGSFAADIVKDAEVTAAYLRQAGAASTSQQRFVFGAARNVFEPSLRRFLVEAKLARRSRALLDFLAWLDRRQPGERDLLFGQAQTPPGVAQVASSAQPLPDLNAALTAAYLHALALNAARARLQKDLQGGATATVTLDQPLTGVLERVTAWMGIEPRGVAIDRLLAERFQLEPEQDYLANYFLGRWNGLDENRRRTRGQTTPASPRYVVIAGSMANLYKAWWPNVGDNDGAVEVASAWLPLGLRDSFYLFEGSAAATSHPALKLNPLVYERVRRELDLSGPAPERRLSPLVRRWWWKDLTWEESGRLKVSRWAPSYLDVDSARLKGQTGTLTFEVESGPNVLSRLWGAVTNGKGRGSGEAPLVWAEGPPAPAAGEDHAARLITLQRKGGRWIGSLTADGFGGDISRLRLGMRLDAQTSDLPDNDRQQVSYRVRFVPTSAQRLASPTGEAKVQPPEVEAPAAKTTGTSSGGPTIWVQRWTRETTHRESEREGHAYWTWDFGDGTSSRDDDPNHLQGEAEHAFPGPGSYRVTATSVSNLGKMLRQLAWDVSVPTADAEVEVPAEAGTARTGMASLVQRFAFETIRPPWLRITLEGPVKWVTGRPASYHVSVETLPVPWVVRQKVTVDPARDFQVAWQKPGTYIVKVAVMVETMYRLPEGGTVTLHNTYLESKRVKVFTPSLTDM